MRATMIAVALAAIAAVPRTAEARNILITNDDGLSSNVKALYEAMKSEGHDVVVSVPCSNQSGMGAAIRFMTPLGALRADCRNQAAKAGDPGAGPMTKAGFERDFFYVDGTPVMAMLYGVDVVAMTRWGRAPDLVLSGPNEGQNVGSIVLTSGTVSNVQVAGSRGLSAIALSAGFATIDDQGLASPQSARVAHLTVQLLSALEGSAKGGALLPQGLALNVNFPDRLEGARWKLTRVGSYDALRVRFASDLGGASPIGPTRPSLPHLPGVIVETEKASPRADQQDDEAAVYQRDIAVSPIHIGYDYPQQTRRDRLARRLRTLMSK